MRFGEDSVPIKIYRGNGKKTTKQKKKPYKQSDWLKRKNNQK
jgi:hypothetical protein